MSWIIFLLLSLASCHAEEGLTLYYWKAQSYMNFGDHLSLKLVERMVGRPIETHTKKTPLGKKKLLAIGSIITSADDMDVVWGSGVKSESINLARYRFQNLDVRAVRGPLTRQFLQDNFQIDCPEVYGDPALLFPYLFPEFQKKASPEFDYIIIPHYEDLHLFEGNSHVVSPLDPWDYVVEQILNSKLVISSSLHGIIIAEAYDIPARLLRVSDSQPLFKFQDYYAGTNRADFHYAHSVEEALLMGGEKPFDCDIEKLYASFPFEYWL